MLRAVGAAYFTDVNIRMLIFRVVAYRSLAETLVYAVYSRL